MVANPYGEACRQVAESFVRAFNPYVDTHLGHEIAVGQATADGEQWLRGMLIEWAEAVPRSQHASPLEMFREALTFPIQAALDAGAIPAMRDDTAAAVLPGDVLDFAPATSRDLGDEAWRTHIAWGIARAEAVAGVVPRPARTAATAVAALVGVNLMDRARFQEAAAAAGYELLVWRNPGAVEAGLENSTPTVVFVDLAHGAANEILRRVVGKSTSVVAFGPHVDDFALAAAKALGADEVLPRSQFFRRLPQLFPSVV